MTAVESSPFAVGSLVRIRDREWVVLPESDDDLLMVRPLGGTDAEVDRHPDRARDGRAGHVRTCPTRPSRRLPLGAAAARRAAPRVPLQRRPVPLASARSPSSRGPTSSCRCSWRCKLDPVRLLIADDVGIGKTVEAGLIARELLDQGDAQRLAVLCPPHLAEQWQAELRDEVPHRRRTGPASTAARLERGLPPRPVAVRRATRYVVVSTDFIKADRRRDDFLRACPELVIVDEAHTCADRGDGRGGRHQRHQLVNGLAADPDASPDPRHRHAAQRQRGGVPIAARPARPRVRRPARRPVRRRERASPRAPRPPPRPAPARRHPPLPRGDTPFPEREERGADLRALRRVPSAVRRGARLRPRDGARHGRRLTSASASAGGRRSRCCGRWLEPGRRGSDAAHPRRAGADAETVEEADDVGRRTVLDLATTTKPRPPTSSPGADPSDDDDERTGPHPPTAARLRRARPTALAGDADAKLVRGHRRWSTSCCATASTRSCSAASSRPAEYVAEQLRARAAEGRVEVAAVTGHAAAGRA